MSVLKESRPEVKTSSDETGKNQITIFRRRLISKMNPKLGMQSDRDSERPHLWNIHFVSGTILNVKLKCIVSFDPRIATSHSS